jgi:hypothetical protein
MPTVYSLPWFFQQFFDDNGAVLAGGKVRTRYANTSTDKDTYLDNGTTANANPIILDSAGRCQIFLLEGAYDFLVYDSDDNLIKTIEDITAQTTTSVTVQSGDTNNCLKLGADYNANTVTDSTNKYGTIHAPHYDTDEEDLGLLAYISTVAGSTVHIGGGINDLNGVSAIRLYVASDDKTLAGTLIADFQPTSVQFLQKLLIATDAPASASATGSPGMITWDTDYIYICVAADTWKRVAISTW